jgi:hypothetical protein
MRRSSLVHCSLWCRYSLRGTFSRWGWEWMATSASCSAPLPTCSVGVCPMLHLEPMLFHTSVTAGNELGWCLRFGHCIHIGNLMLCTSPFGSSYIRYMISGLVGPSACIHCRSTESTFQTKRWHIQQLGSNQKQPPSALVLIYSC